jgi:hypothetical protein
MEKPTNNPLFKHFRQPAIYLKLPSQGRFYPNGSLELSVTGDIPVYPMTVKDELTLKTPDALMNGEGMASVIRSCCPTILDPWRIPAVDLDAIFISIRLASYGTGMDINTTCPKCKEENDHTINLTTVLENVTAADYTEQPLIDNLIFKFKPQSYKDVNKINLATFEERRLVNNILDSEIADEDKKKMFDDSFKKINDLNISMLIDCIDSITADGNSVNDPVMIREFLDNCSRQTYTDIKTKIQEIMNHNKIKPVKVVCSNADCANEYETALEFDQANFFA